ncbi:hypothetical protein [Carboxylicivirga linearis]|uniref:Uncharacterized protein n=1 Tax=Carboxylicivirga linearis TaxID=1628157 RepID=A0ABS5JW98_9BACT|nr:hypothetical protein [Carboxylicivirga linearis]MBS2099128.1 hypothetical protein [Carboxylicivirga linearis]
MKLSSSIINKLENAHNDYSQTDYSLMDRLFGEDNYNISEIINQIEDLIENKCKRLVHENKISLYILFHLKLYFDNTNYQIYENRDILAKNHKVINLLFDNPIVSNKDVTLVMKSNLQLIAYVFGIDIIKYIYSEKNKLINSYISQLRKEAKVKYQFIESINYLKLGNIFKSIDTTGYIPNFLNHFYNQKQNINAVKEYKTKKSSNLNAPGISKAMKTLSEEYLDEVKMDILNFNELEYIDLQDYALTSICSVSINDIDITSLKECFRFQKSSKKGISKLLYPLCTISFNTEDFPTKEEWIKNRQELGYMDDNKAWDTHVKQKVNKYMKFDILFG